MMLPTFIEQVKYANGKHRNFNYWCNETATKRLLGVAPEDGCTIALFRIIQNKKN